MSLSKSAEEIDSNCIALRYKLLSKSLREVEQPEVVLTQPHKETLEQSSRYTGWSGKKAAKLSELSLNFPKLADWLCMGWSVCQAAAKAGNSNRGKVFLHQAVDVNVK